MCVSQNRNSRQKEGKKKSASDHRHSSVSTESDKYPLTGSIIQNIASFQTGMNKSDSLGQSFVILRHASMEKGKVGGVGGGSSERAGGSRESRMPMTGLEAIWAPGTICTGERQGEG